MEYLFIHVPKTAGFAMWKRFREVFGEKHVSAHLHDAYFTDAELGAIFSRKVVHGHLGWQNFWPRRGNRFGMTVLRDPLEQRISHYYFHRDMADPHALTRKLANSWHIEDYFERRPADAVQPGNMIVRQLGAHQLDRTPDFPLALKRAKETLKWCRWVGFYDTLRSDLRRLGTLDEALAPMAFLSAERVTPPYPPASGKVLNCIRVSDAYDIELYEWAKEQFGEAYFLDDGRPRYIPEGLASLMEKRIQRHRGAFIELHLRDDVTDGFGYWTVSGDCGWHQSDFYLTTSAAELMSDAKAYVDQRVRP